MAESTDRQYTNRLVAFIDILGFSQMVADAEQVNRIFDAVVQLDEYTAGFLKNAILDQQTRIDDPQYSFFSDCVVVSCADVPHNYELFFNYLATLSYTMIESGILIRGGVTLGPLIHDARVMFGGGMIKAYKLESGLAVYPRIVIDDKLVKIVSQMPEQWYDRNGARVRGADARGHIRQDFDGMWFIDFLRMWWMGAEIDFTRSWIKKHIGKIIADAPTVQNVQAKIKWLANYASQSAVDTAKEFEIQIRDPFDKDG